MSPDFPTLEDVLKIHDDQINRYGGASGIRDFGLLESALAQPQIIFGEAFLHTDLFEMTAAYFLHIIQNPLSFVRKKAKVSYIKLNLLIENKLKI